MNNTYTIIAIIAVIIIGIGAWMFTQSPATETALETSGESMSDESMMKDTGEMMDKGDSMEGDSMTLKQSQGDATGQVDKADDAMMMAGTFEAYAPEKLAKANEGDVVLFFRASWCPTCRALKADIDAHLSSIPAGVTILDVDYDNSTALKQKYGVTVQHTLVQVDANGNLIKKWMGSPTLASLVASIN